jgi:TetR/AcrR family transcriptional repressor of nem operon
MADLESSTGTKRERLVDAAGALFQEQGFQRTTLAEVADSARVPLGNVYYWFRTKDALLDAVIDAYELEIGRSLASHEKRDGPARRLKALIRSTEETREQTARTGCRYGGLCQELDRSEGPARDRAGELLRLYVSWAELRFRELGLGKRAQGLAVDLVARLQGVSLLTASFSSPELMTSATRRIERWVDELAAS